MLGWQKCAEVFFDHSHDGAEFLHEESNSRRLVQSGEVIREDNCYGKRLFSFNMGYS